MRRVLALVALLLCIVPASSQTINPSDAIGSLIIPQNLADGLVSGPAGIPVCAPSALLITAGSKLLIQVGSALEIRAC